MPTNDTNPELLRRLKAAAYYQGASFGSFGAFFGLVDIRRQAIRESYLRRRPWRAALLNAELSRLGGAFDNRAFRSMLDSFHVEGRPEEIFEQVAAVTSRMVGLGDCPSLRIVDDLPGPSNSKPWDAVSIDPDDSARLKVPDGIYYRRRACTSCYFEFVVAHEVVHWAISRFSSDYRPFTSPVEEGLCDILAIETLAGYGIGAIALSNLLIYNRALQPLSPWNTYWQASRVVASRVSAEGLDSVVRLVRDGREAVNGLDSGAIPRRNGVIVPASVAAIQSASTVIPMRVDALIALSTATGIATGCLVTAAQVQKASGMPDESLKRALRELEAGGWISRLNEQELFVPHRSVPPYIRYTL